MKRLSLLLLLTFFLPLNAGAEEIIKKDELLTLEQCVQIALVRQPNILAARGTVDINQFRVYEAQSNYYPQIAGTAGYSRNKSASLVSSSGQALNVQPPKSNNFDVYSSSLTLNQTIYDFGKTPTQVRIQRLTLDSSKSDFDTVTQQIIFNVRQAYYGILQAQRNRDVAAETVRQNQQHLEQAKGFYEVGTRPKYDVTTAEVNLSNAKLNLIKAENALRIARVTLNNAMGVPDAPVYSIVDNLAYQKYPVTFSDAIQRAYENRPDLQSLAAKVKAAEESIDLAKTGYYPVVSGNANYNWSGDRLSSLQNGWTIGVSVNVPLFSGFLTKNQVDEARSNLSVFKANEESLRQSILLDVQQAYLNLQQAEDQIPTAQLGVQQATENLEIANGRYAAGVGSPVEVTDAEVSYTSAKTAHNQALYDYKVAVATLEKAIGVK